MAKEITLSIILVSYNTEKLTKVCLDSIYKYTKDISFEVVVVDNDSHDDSLKMLSKFSKKYSNFKLIKEKKNHGFSKGNNIGFENSKGKYILLLNSDTEFKSSFLDKIINYIDQNPKVGVLSCALANPDGSLQVSGGYFPTLNRVALWMTIQRLPYLDKVFKPFHPKYAFTTKQEVDWVTGAFFLTRREIINKIGFLDEKYFMYTEEVDFCFRVKKQGYKIMFLPEWEIIHYGGASSSQEFAILSEYRGIKIFYKNHYPKWQYPVMRVFLKIGAVIRMLLISKKVYAKALHEA